MGDEGASRAQDLRGPRVLQVMECTIGGTRRHLVDLCDGLLSRGVDLHVAAAAERQPDFRADLDRLAAAGAVVHEVPMVRSISPAKDARHLARLSSILRDARPDVVHTHSSKAGVLGRLASESTGVGARVHTPHTFAFLFEELFGPLKRRLFFDLERRLGAGTARVVAVSADEAEGFAASGVVDGERLAVIENGIDPAPWRDAVPTDFAATPETAGFDARRPTILCAGLLYAAKGQDILLDALADPRNAAWQCVVAGSGPDEAALADRARALGLADRVRFVGFRRDLPSWMAACDALALPSRWEGMPYVALEAGAAGKPTVATPVDGARAFVDATTGWRAAAITAADVADALAACLDAGAEERERRGAAARERVHTTYDVGRMVDRHVALYEEVA